MPALRILFLSHNFPPEVSAGASRIHEMARCWVADGHHVTVVTAAPNHPAGVLYPGYRNRLWQRETVDGIDVIRVWTYLAPNKGVVRRILGYLSYFLAVVVAIPRLPKSDVIVSTSPQFFCGLAGYPVSRLRRAPWVLEIRDLWPESIVAVGAMQASRVTRALQILERFAYRAAAHIVAVSDAFVPHFLQCGIDRAKISVITNGVDPRFALAPADPRSFRKAHGLEGKFVASYIGTHGMAHQLETVLQAADRLRARPGIAFVLIGDGAERENLVALSRKMALPNVLMLPQMPRDRIPSVWAASGAALVLLRENPVFELVIPSKMLEAMAMKVPILLGVRGHAQAIVERGQCGLTFSPGDPEGLARQAVALADDPELRNRLAENGRRLAAAEYDRIVLAQRYLALLERVAAASHNAGERRGSAPHTP